MTKFLILIYKILSVIFLPIILIIIIFRIFQNKEINNRIKERFAFSSKKRPKGKLIWINASSIGEYFATLSLIKKIRKIKPKTKILLTTNTKTSALLAEKITDKNIFHQFTPQDNPLIIKKFLNYWKPSLVLWMESEFWPIILDETKKYGIEIILLNGRMSDKSFKSWNYFKFFFKEIISNFSLILTMSKFDQNNFKKLGAKNVNFIGNLKFCNEEQPFDRKIEKKIKKIIKNRPVWLAASTHLGEERLATKLHYYYRGAWGNGHVYPNILTIIVPRNPKRAKDIKEDINKGLLDHLQHEIFKTPKAKLFSDTNLTQDTEIIIDDSVGQLELWYKYVKIVFLGKSYPPKGGQNPIEPARNGCTIISGKMSNFKEIEKEMYNKKCLALIEKLPVVEHQHNMEGLQHHYIEGNIVQENRIYEFIYNCLATYFHSSYGASSDSGSGEYADDYNVKKIGYNAKKYVQSKSFILDKTVKTLKKYLV